VQVELQAISQAARHHMGNDWLKIFHGNTMACTINSLRPGCATNRQCCFLGIDVGFHVN
jgi:hypothetical protein